MKIEVSYMVQNWKVCIIYLHNMMNYLKFLILHPEKIGLQLFLN